ncbi:hypothetical protein NLJ89_g11805 [Agrocybe chaxingu]|uniref:Uncharacterized protein n=1 Tax=Agrocybe chaxingu TaxID=84603 RepID=A0A9W8JVM8_9AGAR|nr:hypothetical protein NLJ89_g11805 [Agrocybe chaxingu]
MPMLNAAALVTAHSRSRSEVASSFRIPPNSSPPLHPFLSTSITPFRRRTTTIFTFTFFLLPPFLPPFLLPA